MSRITVLGAGVIGGVYAALLAQEGHEVTVVARGERLDQLRERGLQVVLDGERITSPCRVVRSLDSNESDVLVVAVRGDQLESTLPEVAESSAPTVLIFANPLSLRRQVEERVGRHRVVWCFAGVGGSLEGGMVHAHRVRQQPTVVQDGRPRSDLALELLTPVDPRRRREPDMAAWLDTHTVFIAAMAAVVLGHPLDSRSCRLRAARRLVTAMGEGLRALDSAGIHVTPANLRAIFTQVPSPIAVRYWAHQLDRPVVTVSMVPHARATRLTEQPQVAAYALQLVGARAPRYHELLSPAARHPTGEPT